LALEPKFDARDFAVVWTTPQGAIPAFSRLLTGERVDEVELSADVDAFCASIERSASRFRYVFVPSWTQPAYVREGGLHESRPGGAFLSLSAMNLRLMTQLSRLANVFVLNAARWQAAVGPSAANPRGWYLSRIAASRPLIVEAALDIRAALESLCGRRRSLLVLTSQVGLWGAVTSEPAREAYADFQQTLRQLARNGVALAMVGTGDESTLRREVALQAGWTLSEDILFLHGGDGTDDNPHLRGIADRRGVGLDAVVFLTANDAARAAVRTAVPSVYVPDWPESKLLYPSALQALRCFAAARSAAAGVN
jgi:predicted enzyme involved in methoxymalonyl-ACP biosynthesis